MVGVMNQNALSQSFEPTYTFINVNVQIVKIKFSLKIFQLFLCKFLKDVLVLVVKQKQANEI